MTHDQQHEFLTARGTRLAEVLNVPVDSRGYYITTHGHKNAIGLLHTVMSFVEETRHLITEQDRSTKNA